MLIHCPECGHQVSDKALSCPACGYPMKPQAARRNRSRKRLPNGFAQIGQALFVLYALNHMSTSNPGVGPDSVSGFSRLLTEVVVF